MTCPNVATHTRGNIESASISESTAGLAKPVPNLLAVQTRLYLQDNRITLFKPNNQVPTNPPEEEEPYPEDAIPAKMFTARTIRISNTLKKRKAAVEPVTTVGEKPPAKRGRSRKSDGVEDVSRDKISRRIDNLIGEYEDKVRRGVRAIMKVHSVSIGKMRA